MKKLICVLCVALLGLGGCGEAKKAQTEKVQENARESAPKTPAEQEVACNNGDMESCANLAWRSFSMIDLSQANILSQKACDGGSGVGCAFLGILHGVSLEGKDRDKRDKVKAQELWDKAIPMLEKECNNNQAFSCEILGNAYVEAYYGMQEDFAKGKKFAEKACDLDKSRCGTLAYIYDRGKGVEQDYSKAIALYKQSCEAGSDMGCYEMGRSYEHGEGVERDIHKAKEFYKKACDMGIQKACAYYQRLQDKGE